MPDKNHIPQNDSNVYEMEENTYKELLEAIHQCEINAEDPHDCYREIAEKMGGPSLSRRIFGVLFPTLEGDARGR